jgi:hypothetical protein
MSESAYDITYLLEAELAKFSTPAMPAARTEKALATPAVSEPDAAATQAATARELLDMDGAHEALIRQYMQISNYSS